MYSNGASEIILGRAIKQFKLPRDEIVVLSKVFFPVGHKPDVNVGLIKNPDQEGYLNQHGLSRKHIFDSVKKSLERLQLDYIDVLQCTVTRFRMLSSGPDSFLGHRFDPETPIEETVSGSSRHVPPICSIPNQMQALHDVVQAGYVRYIGMSSCHAWQCELLCYLSEPHINELGLR